MERQYHIKLFLISECVTISNPRIETINTAEKLNYQVLVLNINWFDIVPLQFSVFLVTLLSMFPTEFKHMVFSKHMLSYSHEHVNGLIYH